jgi:hypothetical protein
VGEQGPSQTRRKAGFLAQNLFRQTGALWVGAEVVSSFNNQGFIAGPEAPPGARAVSGWTKTNKPFTSRLKGIGNSRDLL